MKNKKISFKEKILDSDKLLVFIKEVDSKYLDQINEVSLSIFDSSIDSINPNIIRGLWEKAFNRKLSEIFFNILKNDETYVALYKDGYTTIHTDVDDNIVITILDFFVKDYNFETTDRDNNTREYTFYYSITDLSAEDNRELIKGRFDIDLSVMFINQDDYADIIDEDEIDPELDCYEVIIDITNKIFFNKYITEDYNNDNLDQVINKEVMLLRSIFNDLDDKLILNILNSSVKNKIII